MKSMGDRWRQKVENNRILEERAKEKSLRYCYFDTSKAGPTRGPFPWYGKQSMIPHASALRPIDLFYSIRPTYYLGTLQ